MSQAFDRRRKPMLAVQDIDVVARQNVQLMTEVWILKDRLIMLEAMLEKAGLLDRAALNQASPEGALADELDAERNVFVRRVLHDDTQQRSVESLRSLARPRTG